MSGDYISRQAAIDAIITLWANKPFGNPALTEIKECVEQVPSAQPDLEEYSVWFYIGETLVDVSKMHITAEEGIEKIRSYLLRMKKPERKKGEVDTCY